MAAVSEGVRETRQHTLEPSTTLASLHVPQFVLEVLEGAEPRRHVSHGDVCSIGAHEKNDLVLRSDTVSRFHCEIRIQDDRAWLIDVGSRNGTYLDGIEIREAALRPGSLLRLGEAVIRYEPSASTVGIPLSDRVELCGLVGRSMAMRRAFGLIERAAASDATVLLGGETGTGKTAAARAIHELSARRDAPFGVVDCASIAPSLLESELFGHERGAFTGAEQARVGALEAADGGTVFMDEIGEMPLDLQPKLLRFLDERSIRPVGATKRRQIDVRIVAATHRSLRALVNESLFRSDLYYRLAVVELALPPLRARLEDLPLLIENICEDLAVDDALRARLVSPGALRELAAKAWPGNVRELRNTIERRAVLGGDLPVETEHVERAAPYAIARRDALELFERSYVDALLAEHAGNVARAADAAGLDRTYLYRLIRRHRTKDGGS
jgi:two-component system response regulator GlrR